MATKTPNIVWQVYIMGVGSLAWTIDAPTYTKALNAARKALPQYHSSRFRLERATNG